MTDAIAANIRREREKRSWTQEQLAEEADISVRTIQRAERAGVISADVLQALAAAFGIPVEELQHDTNAVLAQLLGIPAEQLTPEFIQQKVAEFESQFTEVPVVPVTSSGDLERAFAAQLLHFDVQSKDDAVLDVAAEIQQYLTALLNVSRELDPIDQRRCARELFEIVQRLDTHNCKLLLGSRRERFGKEDPPLNFTALYALVAPKQAVLSGIFVRRQRGAQTV